MFRGNNSRKEVAIAIPSENPSTSSEDPTVVYHSNYSSSYTPSTDDCSKALHYITDDYSTLNTIVVNTNTSNQHHAMNDKHAHHEGYNGGYHQYDHNKEVNSRNKKSIKSKTFVHENGISTVDDNHAIMGRSHHPPYDDVSILKHLEAINEQMKSEFQEQLFLFKKMMIQELSTAINNAAPSTIHNGTAIVPPTSSASYNINQLIHDNNEMKKELEQLKMTMMIMRTKSTTVRDHTATATATVATSAIITTDSSTNTSFALEKVGQQPDKLLSSSHYYHHYDPYRSVKPLVELTIDDVSNLLTHLNLDAYQQSFKEHCIDGPHLMLFMSENEVKEAGILLTVKARYFFIRIIEYKLKGVPVSHLQPKGTPTITSGNIYGNGGNINSDSNSIQQKFKTSVDVDNRHTNSQYTVTYKANIHGRDDAMTDRGDDRKATTSTTPTVNHHDHDHIGSKSITTKEKKSHHMLLNDDRLIDNSTKHNGDSSQSSSNAVDRPTTSNDKHHKVNRNKHYGNEDDKDNRPEEAIRNNSNQQTMMKMIGSDIVTTSDPPVVNQAITTTTVTSLKADTSATSISDNVTKVATTTASSVTKAAIETSKTTGAIVTGSTNATTTATVIKTAKVCGDEDTISPVLLFSRIYDSISSSSMIDDVNRVNTSNNISNGNDNKHDEAIVMRVGWNDNDNNAAIGDVSVIVDGKGKQLKSVDHDNSDNRMNGTRVNSSTIINSIVNDYSQDDSRFNRYYINDESNEEIKDDSNSRTKSSDKSVSFDLNISTDIVKKGLDLSIMDINNISNIHNITTDVISITLMSHDKYDSIYTKILLDSCTLDELNSLKHHARQGDLMALSYISLLHHIGSKHIAKDRLKAVEYASQSIQWLQSRYDDKYCLYILGYYYFYGISIDEDKIKAIEYHKLSAELGYARAQCSVGLYYRNGIGIARDYNKAYHYLMQAVDQKFADAQFYVGICYKNGNGVKKNLTYAAIYFKYAADQGHAIAQCNLGICYEYGQGVNKNIEEAIRYYQLSSNQCNARAQYYLSVLIKSNVATDISTTDDSSSNSRSGYGDSSRTDDYRNDGYKNAYSKISNDASTLGRLNYSMLNNKNDSYRLDNSKSHDNINDNNNKSNLDYSLDVFDNTDRINHDNYGNNHHTTSSVMVIHTASSEAKSLEMSDYPNNQYQQQRNDQSPQKLHHHHQVHQQHHHHLIFEECDKLYAKVILEQVTIHEIDHILHHVDHNDDVDFVACCYAAMLYNGGTELLRKDRTRSIEYASKSIDWIQQQARSPNNNKYAQFILGYYYFYGICVYKSISDAVRYYRLAADQNLSMAQCKLGLCYRSGRGVMKDEGEFARYYKLAADNGFSYAQCCMGECYINSIGVVKDDVTATRYYKLSADQGYARAQCYLGECYDSGRGVSKDEYQAARYYKQAAEQGYARAQCYLGLCYDSGRGVLKNEDEAARYYKRAADQGYARAQCYLAQCYNSGKGVIQDEVEAMKYFKLSADQGHARAQYNLGVCYKYGVGCAADKAESDRYFQLANNQGFQQT